MKIDSISDERRMSDHEYGNRAFRASATLDEGEDATLAGDALRTLVFDQSDRDIKEEEARRDAEHVAREEEWARQRAEREAELVREREERRREREALMGRDVAITVPAVEDDIPFDDEEEDDE